MQRAAISLQFVVALARIVVIANYKTFVSLGKVWMQELQGCANCNDQVVRRDCKTLSCFKRAKLEGRHAWMAGVTNEKSNQLGLQSNANLCM